jgi:hypothetical protein
MDAYVHWSPVGGSRSRWSEAEVLAGEREMEAARVDAGGIWVGPTALDLRARQ